MGLKKIKTGDKWKKKKLNPLEVLKERKNRGDVLEEELEKKGTVFFSPETNLDIDEDFLFLPRNITDVSDRDLGEHLNAYTQQKVYMRTLLGWAQCLCDEAREEYYAASHRLYSELSKTKMSEKSKDREVNSDPDVFPYYEKYMDESRKCSLLEMNIANIEDIIFMLSREVTRRNADFANENRVYSVYGK